jgi:hypothetical protein
MSALLCFAKIVAEIKSVRHSPHFRCLSRSVNVAPNCRVKGVSAGSQFDGEILLLGVVATALPKYFVPLTPNLPFGMAFPSTDSQFDVDLRAFLFPFAAFCNTDFVPFVIRIRTPCPFWSVNTALVSSTSTCSCSKNQIRTLLRVESKERGAA